MRGWIYEHSPLSLIVWFLLCLYLPLLLLEFTGDVFLLLDAPVGLLVQLPLLLGHQDLAEFLLLLLQFLLQLQVLLLLLLQGLVLRVAVILTTRISIAFLFWGFGIGNCCWLWFTGLLLLLLFALFGSVLLGCLKLFFITLLL